MTNRAYPEGLGTCGSIARFRQRCEIGPCASVMHMFDGILGDGGNETSVSSSSFVPHRRYLERLLTSDLRPPALAIAGGVADSGGCCHCWQDQHEEAEGRNVLKAGGSLSTRHRTQTNKKRRKKTLCSYSGTLLGPLVWTLGDRNPQPTHTISSGFRFALDWVCVALGSLGMEFGVNWVCFGLDWVWRGLALG